jgi:hypothetical protein
VLLLPAQASQAQQRQLGAIGRRPPLQPAHLCGASSDAMWISLPAYPSCRKMPDAQTAGPALTSIFTINASPV